MMPRQADIDAACELIEDMLRFANVDDRPVLVNRLRGVVDRAAPPKQSDPQADIVAPMSRTEAEEFEMVRLPYGQHRGLTYAEVPASYLAWLADRKRTEWRSLLAYVRFRNG